jgi:hypothetical protein
MTKPNCVCIPKLDKEYWATALDIAQNFYEDEIQKMTTNINHHKDISLPRERLKNVIDLGNNIRDIPNCKEGETYGLCFTDSEKVTIDRVNKIIEYYSRELGNSYKQARIRYRGKYRN